MARDFAGMHNIFARATGGLTDIPTSAETRLGVRGLSGRLRLRPSTPEERARKGLPRFCGSDKNWVITNLIIRLAVDALKNFNLLK
ncbi:hypothetical protein WA026_023661 [Henosepilachna vigintioctopunctata]|uniref:Transposase n=1 Tax=Henosepilachna vigintioctopunctata TaxID=420089 RepID=A0AAW1V649_9CUCU